MVEAHLKKIAEERAEVDSCARLLDAERRSSPATDISMSINDS